VFKINLGVFFYHVVFQYEAPGQKKFSKRKSKTHSVRCRILRQGEYDSELDTTPWIIEAEGMSRQFSGGTVAIWDGDGSCIKIPEVEPDCYNKKEGRKMAFERALKNMTLDRDGRTAFWQGYGSMLPKNKNGETKWK
jgi:hypothetical protein